MSAAEERQGPRDSAPQRLSHEGFAQLYKAEGRMLWCIAAAVLGDRGQADDIVQESAVIALQKLGDFDASTCFAAWMGRIVRNVALNHARRRQRRSTVASDPALIDAGRAAPEPGGPGGEAGEGVHGLVSSHGALAPDQRSFDDHVLAALDALDETARACLLLRTILDMPYQEISRALDIPEGTAMSHVHRARRALRERLEGRLERVATEAGDRHG